jgi:Mob1/phocein family
MCAPFLCLIYAHGFGSADVPFPKTFINTVKVIFKRLFRVYAHIYFSHFDKIMSLSAEAHLNTCFKHFSMFVKEFDLVDAKELQPLAHLIDNLTNPPSASGVRAAGGSASH